MIIYAGAILQIARMDWEGMIHNSSEEDFIGEPLLSHQVE